MEGLIAFGLTVAVMLILAVLVRTIRRQQAGLPSVMLSGLPDEILYGREADTPEVRKFREELRALFDDFDRAAGVTQYRQMLDVMAVAPGTDAARIASYLSRTSSLERYAGDRELRFELGLIATHNLRGAATREARASYLDLLDRLREIGRGFAEAEFAQWFAPLAEEDLGGEDPRRELHAAVAIQRLGGEPDRATLDEWIAGQPNEHPVHAELQAASAGPDAAPPEHPLPEPTRPWPTFAEAIAEGENAGSAGSESAT